MFVTFEGIDGSGKSTQLRRLQQWLEQQGVTVVATREPGGTAVAEAVRELLLNPSTALAPAAELLLFGAARAQHVADVIAPALRRGDWVLCDRFGDSSVAYQGGGLGLDAAFIRSMNTFATAGALPKLTLLFDLEPEIAARRMCGQRADVIEARGQDFQARVRAAYLSLAQEHPQRYTLVDAAGSEEAVFAQLVAAAQPWVTASGEQKSS